MDVAFGTDETRDLGSLELWERSLKRARHRRRIAEMSRRNRRRRKGTSVAVTAAMAAGPVIPTATAIADSGPGAASTHHVDPAKHDPLSSSAQHVVLRYGSTGQLVAAAQMRLNAVVPAHHLVVDGIYGPLTRAAVEDFQSRQDLGSTGRIDTRTWADLFNAPVLTLADTGSENGAGSGTSVPVSTNPAPATPQASHPRAVSAVETHPGSSHAAAPTSQPAANGTPTRQPTSSGSGGGGNAPVAVVTPTNPTSQSVAYVLSNGVALPLPRGYLGGGSVDQGVDYAAPGGTPLYAMGDGVIIGAGISGFGPNAPILKITSGPLKGMEIYYGHAGANSVHVGQHVRAGQQISQVGYGIVGISTGPHLEVGFYPPGAMGAGSRMLSLINSLLHQHPSGRVWGAKTAKAATVKTAVARASAARSTTSTSASTVRVSETSTPSTTAHVSTASDRSSGGVAPAAASTTASPAPKPDATTGTPDASAPAAAATPDAPSTPAPSSAPAASSTPAASAAPADTPAPAPAPASSSTPAPSPAPAASSAPSDPAPATSDSGSSASSSDAPTTSDTTTTTSASTSSTDSATAPSSDPSGTTSSTPDATSSTPDATSSTPDATSSTPDATSSTPDATSTTTDTTTTTTDTTTTASTTQGN
jgi:hypothetical protein